MQIVSSSPATALVQPAEASGSTMPTYEHPLHAISFAQLGADAAASPLDEPLLDPELDPLLDPLEDPLLEPLEEPLLLPLLDPLEEPLLDPLEDPLDDPLLLPLSVSAGADASSLPVPKPPPLLLDEHAASNPSTPPDAHTNLLIFNIDCILLRIVRPNGPDGSP
jgi:hypothetical protein